MRVHVVVDSDDVVVVVVVVVVEGAIFVAWHYWLFLVLITALDGPYPLLRWSLFSLLALFWPH